MYHYALVIDFDIYISIYQNDVKLSVLVNYAVCTDIQIRYLNMCIIIVFDDLLLHLF